jgi:hypothetical protein
MHRGHYKPLIWITISVSLLTFDYANARNIPKYSPKYGFPYSSEADVCEIRVIESTLWATRCVQDEVDRLNRMMTKMTVRIGNALVLSERHKFLKLQNSWFQKIRTGCDDEPDFKDFEGGFMEKLNYALCVEFKTANHILWLRKHYHRALGH